ncbi:MAG: Na+/H+ antiporter subunit E [Deinococcota bacterium]|nr:Na+/H+ antiporter subunit E [Deinococcota bacterium]
MNLLVWNLGLALLWAAVTAEFTLYNLLVGAVLGFLVLFVTRPLIGETRYFHRPFITAGFLLFFIRELVVSSLKVAYEVITPGFRMRPGVVAVPLEVKTDAEITLLANLITLTPGTLSLDVSSDKRVLYVHAMYVTNAEAVRKEIKGGLERKVLEVMR